MATGVELSDVQAPVKSSPPTNRHPAFYRPDALPVAQPTASDNLMCYTAVTVNHALLSVVSSGLGYWHQRADERHGNPSPR